MRSSGTTPAWWGLPSSGEPPGFSWRLLSLIRLELPFKPPEGPPALPRGRFVLGLTRGLLLGHRIADPGGQGSGMFHQFPPARTHQVHPAGEPACEPAGSILRRAVGGKPIGLADGVVCGPVRLIRIPLGAMGEASFRQALHLDLKFLRVAFIQVHVPGAIPGENQGLLWIWIEEVPRPEREPTGQLRDVFTGEVSEGSGVHRR